VIMYSFCQRRVLSKEEGSEVTLSINKKQTERFCVTCAVN
jgi:hypothetical protein